MGRTPGKRSSQGHVCEVFDVKEKTLSYRVPIRRFYVALCVTLLLVYCGCSGAGGLVDGPIKDSTDARVLCTLPYFSLFPMI